MSISISTKEQLLSFIMAVHNKYFESQHDIIKTKFIFIS